LVNFVLIDFADFRSVMGDKQAREAFDVGWAVLHELDHVVTESTDAELTSGSGDCEAHINQMRLENGLPVRVDYFFSFLPHTQDLHFVSKFVRLRFEGRDRQNKTRRYSVFWDAAIVGGIPTNNRASSLSSYTVRTAPPTDGRR
jgi:hypothetical protein